MTVCLWKRFSLLLVTALTLIAVGCSKKVAPAPPPPPPPPPPPAPTITLTVDRPSITAGQGAVLSYTATNATSVTIDPGIGAVQPATSGTRQINPTQTTSFTARATGPGGTANSAAVNIVVNQPAAAPPPPPPPPVNKAPAVAAAAGPTIDQLFTTTMTPILFDYDKATIRASEESKLLNIASWLKQNPTLRFTIEGHADERGGQEYNVALSDERAASVKKYLAGQGIAEGRMNTIPYGEERPSCRQTTEACFQENRRAAFTRIP